MTQIKFTFGQIDFLDFMISVVLKANFYRLIITSVTLVILINYLSR